MFTETQMTNHVCTKDRQLTQPGGIRQMFTEEIALDSGFKGCIKIACLCHLYKNSFSMILHFILTVYTYTIIVYIFTIKIL